jgi:uncharacterized protein (UPF0276 family)
MKFGIGWREEAYASITSKINEIEVIEILADQYMFDLRKKSVLLSQLLPTKPIIFHCVGLSIGSYDIDMKYLLELKVLVDKFNPLYISDHIGITKYNSYDTGIACPISYDLNSLAIIAKNVETIQNTVGKPLIIENISIPFQLPDQKLSEPEFIARLYEETGVYLLLDATNLYINCKNYGFDYRNWLEAIPPQSIKQIHLAGGNLLNGRLLDSHCCKVHTENWEIYQTILEFAKNIDFVIVERDSRYEEFNESINDIHIARSIYQSLLNK